MISPIEIKTYGEQALLINWPQKIDPKVSEELLYTKEVLSKKYAPKLIDISNGYCSLLLYFKENVTAEIIASIQIVIENLKNSSKKNSSRTWEIPVCYDYELGIDLEFFLKKKRISLAKLIALHTQPIYHVYCKGFLPGFLYLGGLTNTLHLDRKSTPTIKMPKNSVAIGGEQTGIYPTESPGGWYSIGRTPIPLFNINTSPFSPIKNGDTVRFTSITKHEYDAIENTQNLKNIE